MGIQWRDRSLLTFMGLGTRYMHSRVWETRFHSPKHASATRTLQTLGKPDFSTCAAFCVKRAMCGAKSCCASSTGAPPDRVGAEQYITLRMRKRYAGLCRDQRTRRASRASPRVRDDARGHGTDRAARAWWRAIPGGRGEQLGPRSELHTCRLCEQSYHGVEARRAICQRPEQLSKVNYRLAGSTIVNGRDGRSPRVR